VDRHAWLVLSLSSVGVFVVFLDATIVNIAFSSIGHSFAGSSTADLSWVFNAYAVVLGALLVTCGQLADEYGRKRMFLAGLVVFGLASALCGMAPSVGLLIAARALQGVGAAMLVPASLGLLLPEFPATMRATVVGLWGAAGSAAAATGPALGALLIDGPGWRWVFYLNVPLCAATWLMSRKTLRESRAREVVGRPDFLGVAMVIVTFGALSLFIVEGSNWGWTSPREIAANILATLFVPALIKRGRTHARPVLPVALFAVRTFTIGNLGTLFFATAFFASLLCNVLFLSDVWHYSLLRTAAGVLPAPVVATMAAPTAGRLADRYGFRAVIVPGACAMVGAQLWLATQTGSTPNYLAEFFPGNVMAGVGVGFAFAALGAAAAKSVPPDQFAIGSAMVATSRQMGAVVGIAVFVAVFGHPSTGSVLHAFHRAWLVNLVAAVACLATCLGLRARRHEPVLSPV